MQTAALSDTEVNSEPKTGDHLAAAPPATRPIEFVGGGEFLKADPCERDYTALRSGKLAPSSNTSLGGTTYSNAARSLQKEQPRRHALAPA